MTPFVIFAIVLTVGYIFYFGIVIAHDLYGKKGQENTDEEHFDVLSMRESEDSTQVDEEGDSFRIGGKTVRDEDAFVHDTQEKFPSVMSEKGTADEPQESIVEKTVASLQDSMEDTVSLSSYAMSGTELYKALLGGEVSHSNGIDIRKVIVTDKV